MTVLRIHYQEDNDEETVRAFELFLERKKWVVFLPSTDPYQDRPFNPHVYWRKQVVPQSERVSILSKASGLYHTLNFADTSDG